MMTKSIDALLDLKLGPRTSFSLPLATKLALDTAIVVSPVLLSDLAAYSESITPNIATFAYFHAISMFEAMPLMIAQFRLLRGICLDIAFNGLFGFCLMARTMAVCIWIWTTSSMSMSPLVNPVKHIVVKTTSLFHTILTCLTLISRNLILVINFLFIDNGI